MGGTVVAVHEDQSFAIAKIKTIHTLGPTGTNLEMAAQRWLAGHDKPIDVRLHNTLEAALPTLPIDGRHAILACAVYPDLHRLVFSSLDRMQMVDSFIAPTYPMVLASRGDVTKPTVIASHPAPAGLVERFAQVKLSTSNSQAALDCAAGLVDGCITTSKAAAMHSLEILQDFGPVPMVFTVHQVQDSAQGFQR
jgi:hypothetical protein